MLISMNGGSDTEIREEISSRTFEIRKLSKPPPLLIENDCILKIENNVHNFKLDFLLQLFFIFKPFIAEI